MSWLALIPLVIKLVGFVETLFGEAKGQGEVKKSTVLGATQAIVDGVASVSTGGQKETWEAISPVVGSVVDAVVGIANVVGWEGITDDTVQDDMRNGL